MNPVHQTERTTIYHGDALKVLRGMENESVQCCVTSPPYWGLRDYGVEGQYGLEETPGQHVARMVEVFAEVRRVLRDDGTLWMNYGDSYTSGIRTTRDPGKSMKHPAYAEGNYPVDGRPHTPAGLKPKDLIGMPWRVAFALQEDGWYLRTDIIWHKPNPMPESVRDRPTRAHEYIFLMSKSEQYYYDQDAILEPASPSTHARMSQNVGEQAGSLRVHGGDKDIKPIKAVARGVNPKARTINQNEKTGHRPRQNESFSAAIGRKVLERNKRTVWTVGTKPYSGAHFAVYPPALIEPCIRAGCPARARVLDPFMGSATTGQVALQLGCHFVGIEINREYIDNLAVPRLERIEDQGELF